MKVDISNHEFKWDKEVTITMNLDDASKLLAVLTNIGGNGVLRIDHKLFNILGSLVKDHEYWGVYKAYCLYVHKSMKVSDAPDPEKIKKFVVNEERERSLL